MNVNFRRSIGPLALMSLAMGITACAPRTQDDTINKHAPVSLSMALPDSLTGGGASTSGHFKGTLTTQAAANPGQLCQFKGANGADIMRNGYNMSRFLISTVATWTCISDVVIAVSAYVPHDDRIHATANVLDQPGYNPKDPTHYRVTDNDADRTTVRLYYGFAATNPPTPESDPQFFVTWRTDDHHNTTGRLIMDALGIHADRKDGDPIAMRMDFDYTPARKLADMFVRFEDTHPWADGMRLQLKHDLQANITQKVFLARGALKMKRQFAPVDGITETPVIRMATVANSLGRGATVARFNNVSIPLIPNADLGNHLGNYLVDKNDYYYFDAAQNWEWIRKNVTASTFRGGRTTPASGGSWQPFSPSLDMIISALHLETDYFTGDKCAVVGNGCNDMFNALLHSGFDLHEQNAGQDPHDWRNGDTENPVYLDSIYPNGQNWDEAFVAKP